VRKRAATRLPTSAALALPLLVLVALAGGGLLLFGLGVLGGGDATPKEDTLPEGWMALPAAGQDIPAYTAIELEHFFDGSGRPVVVRIPEESLLETTLVDPADIVGRVLRHDKKAGRPFSQADFLPEGTRPGIVAGIPPGKRAMRIETAQVSGLVGLAAGDRLDIVATLRQRGARAGMPRIDGPYAGGLADAARQARVDVVARDAVVVSPRATRTLQTGSAGGGARVVEEVVIAVSPDEVAPLTEALALEARLDAVPRSGRPDEDGSSATGAKRPRSPFALGGAAGDVTVVETIGGSQRGMVAVPTPASEPAEEAEAR